ncbi:hypothetical protein Daus18300_003615 [Diaporthe australafricana]|uniref:Uncharacterized protein n=1 Tax=Diaporthe australafricana TaxID=127596 RepID=A0ABR3XE57_9PEZI
MSTTDPSEPGASDDAGHSVPLGPGFESLEVPMFSTRQHLDYLVGLITNAWRKTFIMWKNTPANAGIAPSVDELVIYNPGEDCVISFRVDQIPEAIHKKVDCLLHMQRIGLSHLKALVELLKEEIDKITYPTSSDESSGSSETESSVVDMLAELARHQLQTEYAEKKELGFNLTVVFMNASDHMEKRFHFLHHDTDFTSFLALMDDYPISFDQNVAWAASIWDEKLRSLKSTGYDGHPSLMRIEQLIAAHNATNYDDGPKWMYYKTNERIYNTKEIDDEDVFKKIVEILTNPAKKNQQACMIRVVDQKLIQILGELRCLEIEQKESVHSNEQAASQRTQDELSALQTDGKHISCSDNPCVWDMLFDFISKTLGGGVFRLDTSDDEEQEGVPMEE